MKSNGATHAKPAFLEESPRYPWRSYSLLRTHDFVEMFREAGAQPFRFFECRTCGRRFRFDSESRLTRAIAQDPKLSELHASVSSRWLAERCAGRRTEADEQDAKKLKRRAG